MTSTPLVASVELGGTKIVCGLAAADAPTEVLATDRFPTTSPDEVLAKISAFLESAEQPVAAVGIASFGPVNVDPDEERYGWITATPKPGWSDTPLIEGIPFVAARPHAVMSDVSAAALAEHAHGAGRGARSVAYVTVGTGIGAGLIVQDRLVQGNGFPEAGHLLVRRHPDDDFAGSCPFHGDCAEGLACGPAAAARWGRPLPELEGAEAEAAADILSFYIAQLAHDLNVTAGAERVVIGGGVTNLPGVRPGIDRWLATLRRAPYGVALEVREPVFPDAGLIGGFLAAAQLAGA